MGTQKNIPEISIIVPVYKVEQYLNRCVKSILNQSFDDLELILVDDGSPDRCPQMCDSWKKKDARIRVIHKKNGGLSSARNAGLDIARGKYIGFVDSDDFVAADMYEYLHALIQKYAVDISACSFTRNKNKLNIGTVGEKICLLNKKDIKDYFYRIHGEASNYSVWNKLYKAELFKKVRFREGIINEDVIFDYEIYKVTDSMLLSSLKKYFYFKNQNGITKIKLNDKDLILFKIWDEIITDEKDPFYCKWAKKNRIRATFTLYTKALVCGKNKTITPQVVQEWRKELKKTYPTLLENNFLHGIRKLLYLIICRF